MSRSLRDLGERAVINDILTLEQIGDPLFPKDDCAVLDIGDSYLLLSTDTMNSESHIPKGSNLYDAGRYACAVNLSDIAAMGGEPKALLFAFGLPADMHINDVMELSKGVESCAAEHVVRVVGGDMKESSLLTVTGTAVGSVKKDEILSRSGAKIGNLIAVTGEIGWPYAAHAGIGNGRKMLDIAPRINEGRILSRLGATSCIDLSDGLQISLHHLSDRSGVGMIIQWDKIPFSEVISTDEQKAASMRFGGEFELLFSAPMEKMNTISSEIGKTGTPISVIGRVFEGRKVILSVDGYEKELEAEGYEHFR